MGVKRLEDLVAFKLAVEFKLAVYSLVRDHRNAYLDFRWRSQLFEAAADVESDIAEGWRRFRKRELCQFFRYALASLEEAKRRLIDGVHRGHYSQSSAEPVLVLGRRMRRSHHGVHEVTGRIRQDPCAPSDPRGPRGPFTALVR